MDFGANKTPVEVIKEDAFRGTYFRDIYLVLMESGTESQGKNLISWKMLVKILLLKLLWW